LRWPLASHIEGFAAQLFREGYAPNTVRAKCDVLADLSRWLERRGLPLSALAESRLKHFQAARRRRGEARRGDPATGEQLLAYLRNRDDIAAAVQKIDETPAACLTREYEEFLRSERGLSRSTVITYLPIVRCFLAERFGCKALRLAELRPQRALQRYATRRDRCCHDLDTPSFFVSDRGTRLTEWCVRWTFVKLSHEIGLRGAGDSRGPRLHDLRHRLAINTLLRWYRRGVDV